MKIPKSDTARITFYQEILRSCLNTRMDRFQFYSTLRNYYLFGTRGTQGSAYNKIGSTIETLASFMYAPDAARFDIHLGTTAPKSELAKVPAMKAEMNDQWRMTKAHLTFGLGLKWSMVFGCMIFKGLWTKGSPRPYLVTPDQFGVLREDIPTIEDQEAFVHCYTITRGQLEAELESNPRANLILEQITRGGDIQENTSEMGAGMQRLVLSQGIPTSASTGPGGTMEGGITGGGSFEYTYTPKVDHELIDMYELYVWNDEVQNYQIVTLANPNVIVYDREQPGVRGMATFTKLAPEENLTDYFWGESFAAKLTKLQDMREDRMTQIRKLLAMQADPPMTAIGFPGLAEEKFAGMRSPGGRITSPMPGAKFESYAPDLPENLFREVGEIDRMFEDVAGLGHILQGKGEPGVRSKGQADLMARLGSARPKQRAIVVEESAEDLATLMLRLVQENSKQRFTVPGDKNNSPASPLIFTPAQFTNDFEVKVDAHSSSPIFVEDRKQDALTLLEVHAVDREYVLDVFNPPGLQLLKAKLPAIEKAEQEAAAREQAQKAGGK